MKIVKNLDVPIYNTSVCFVIGDITKEDLDILRQDNPDKIDELSYREFVEGFFDKDKCDGLTATVADGTYLVFIRGGCWFCPNGKLKQFIHIRKNYPSMWNELRELSLTPNLCSYGFKYGKTFQEIERKMDEYELKEKTQLKLDL